MRYDQRLAAAKRHELWSEFCDLTDRLLELTTRWWNVDTDLVDAHYDRCRLQSSNLELEFPTGEPAEPDNDL
jgi:hypothetical protein